MKKYAMARYILAILIALLVTGWIGSITYTIYKETKIERNENELLKNSAK